MLGVTVGLIGTIGSQGAAEALSAPVNTVAPAITRNTAYGSTLTSTTGTWTGNPAPTYGYQWRKAGVDIGGATSSTYVTLVGDVGSAITCRVTATNSVGSSSATSNAITPADPAQTALNAIVAGFLIAPSASRQATMKAFITTLMNTTADATIPGVSVWATRDRLVVLKCGEQQGALLNWIAPGTGNATVVGAAITFTADVGVATLAASYLTTSYDPFAGGFTTRNNNSIAASVLTDANDGVSAFLCGSVYFGIQPRTSAGVISSKNASSGTDAGSANTGAALYTISRNVSGSYGRYKGATLVDSPTRATVALPTGNPITILTANSGTNVTTKTLDLFHCGGYMDAAAVSAVDAAWSTFKANY